MKQKEDKTMLSKNNILDFLTSIKPKLKDDGIEKIGLFGSFAKDKADLFSDVDIVIKTTDDFIKKHRDVKAFIYLEELRKSISRSLKRKVDICDESGLKDKKILDGVIYV